MQERRAFNRINLKLELTFQDLTCAKKGKAETLDISANGLCFITRELLPAKTPLEIWLVVPDHREPFHTKGEVVWSMPLTGTDKQRVGVRI